jgi:hypothetical protein
MFFTVFVRVRHRTVLSQLNPIRTVTHYFEIRLNIIIPSSDRTTKSLSFKFSHQQFVYISFLSHACCMLRLSDTRWCDKPNNICSTVQIYSLSTCNCLHLREVFSEALFLTLAWDTKFHTHIILLCECRPNEFPVLMLVTNKQRTMKLGAWYICWTGHRKLLTSLCSV